MSSTLGGHTGSLKPGGICVPDIVMLVTLANILLQASVTCLVLMGSITAQEDHKLLNNRQNPYI